MSLSKKLWLSALVIPSFELVGSTMCTWSQPRLLGSIALPLLAAQTPLVLLVLLAVPLVPCFLIIGVLRMHNDRQFLQGLSRALACTCMIAAWALAFIASLHFRHDAFVRAEKVGNRVVDALAQYHKNHDAYPITLAELVPAYLPEVPHTGLIGYPDYKYRRGFNDLEERPGDYELYIPCPFGLIDFDRFIYWPSEKYPDTLQGNGVERIGRWAYIHE